MKPRTRYLCGGVVLLLVAAPFVAYWAYRNESMSRQNAATKRLAALGYPTSEGELLARKPSPAENAASEYSPLLSEIRAKGLTKLVRGDESGPLTAAEIVLLDREVALLDRADRILSRPKLWFDRDYERGFDLIYPESRPLRTLGTLLTRRAVLDARRGNFDRARQRLHTVRAMARHLIDDPSIALLSQALLVSVNDAVLRIALEAKDKEQQKLLRRELTTLAFVGKSYLVGDIVAAKTHRDFTAFANEPKDRFEHWFLNQDQVAERIRALTLEALAEYGEAFEGGVTPSELQSIFDDESSRESLRLFGNYAIRDRVRDSDVDYAELNILWRTVLELVIDKRALVPVGLKKAPWKKGFALRGSKFTLYIDESFIGRQLSPDGY